jgi:hypothetical protein
VRDVPEHEIDSTCVLAESVALEIYFQSGLRQELNTDEAGGSENSDSDEDEEGLDDSEDIVDNVRTHSALAWADKFILETRRKSGRQTENSVLKLWKVCTKKRQGPVLKSVFNFIIDLGFRGNRFWPPA